MTLIPLRAAPVPLWRSDPYRILFPLGVALAWAGALHWLLFAVGVTGEYRSVFHSMAQIQGFMACFAAGFLLTFIPRRTSTAAPSAFEVAIAAAAPVATTVLAWMEQWVLAEIAWLLLLGMLLVFALRRVRAGRTRQGGPESVRAVIPGRFVWVVAAIVCGAGGAILAALGAALDQTWLDEVGRALVFQGTFSALIFGVGGIVLPPFIHGRPAPEREPVSAHVALALLFVGSFFLDAISLRLAFGVRAAMAAALLLPHLGMPPVLPGLHRRLLWVATLLLPFGNLAVAAFPGYRRIGLHVIFIGSFALMALATSVHLALAHGGQFRKLETSPLLLRAMAVLLYVALSLRLLVDLEPGAVRLWIGGATAAFLAATIFWLLLVGPVLGPAESPRTDHDRAVEAHRPRLG